MRLPNRIINYELCSDYCFDLGRSGTSSFRTRLELLRHARPDWECHLPDAFACSMDRVRKTRRKRHSDIILVLEHRLEPHHVLVFSFSAGSGWHSAEHNCLSSQFDVHPKKKTCFHRGHFLAGTAGNELAELLIRTFVCGIQWKPSGHNGVSLYFLALF